MNCFLAHRKRSLLYSFVVDNINLFSKCFYFLFLLLLFSFLHCFRGHQPKTFVPNNWVRSKSLPFPQLADDKLYSPCKVALAGKYQCYCNYSFMVGKNHSLEKGQYKKHKYSNFW